MVRGTVIAFVASLLLWMIGTSSVADSNQPPSTAPAHAAPTSNEQPLVAGERRLMGTVWRLSIYTDPAHASEARQAIETALNEVDRLEQLLSEWRPTSEISRVNASAGHAPVVVGPELMRCVQVGVETARWSQGAFDISWASLRDLWDFSETSRHVPPSAAQVRARLPLWNWRNIAVNPQRNTIFLRRRGMAIGLGGIAKGYALDRVAEMFHRKNFHNFLLFGGGQVRVGGQRGDRPWRVGIQHPRTSDYFAFVEVSGDASVSTSGDYEHSWMHEGRRYHHIIDPHTGFPSERSSSVTVISPSALWADAVDTAVFILGPQKGLRLLKHAPDGPHEAVVIDKDLRMWTSATIKEKLVMRVQLDERGRLP